MTQLAGLHGQLWLGAEKELSLLKILDFSGEKGGQGASAPSFNHFVNWTSKGISLI